MITNKKSSLEDMTTNDHYIINQAPDNPQDDTISLLAVNELLKVKKTNTRLLRDQVNILTRLYLYSSTFKIPFLKTLADNICQLQVSINGLGRKELVQLVQKRSDMIEVPNNKIFHSKDVFR